MTSVVIAIASISNDNLQDLKTGQLVGATPWRQQIALLLGSVAGAIASPVCVLPAQEVLSHARTFKAVLEDWEPELLLCGRPKTLAGDDGPQAPKNNRLLFAILWCNIYNCIRHTW